MKKTRFIYKKHEIKISRNFFSIFEDHGADEKYIDFCSNWNCIDVFNKL